jgi:hypothetical protein
MHGFPTKFIVVILACLGLSVGVAGASVPASHTVTVPSAAGQTVTITWSGTIPASAGPTNSCTPLPAALTDPHDVTVNVPAGLYNTVTAQFTFQITWTPVVNINTSDEILTVLDPDGNEVGSSDGGEPVETVGAADLRAGTYRVLACGFANPQPQPYNGKLTITTAAAEASLPAAPAQGLEFSASVAADNQRDEAEPLVEIDPDGNMYTCGPTGFSNASDYAQVSTDNGDQFHLLGEPPRGQQGAGGGGDCGLGTGIVRNTQGKFQYAYTGLGPLTGFVSSTSPNNGHNLTTGGPQAAGVTSQGGGADRQWNVFLDDLTVLLSYNQQEPRNVVIQKSTDGGLTYSPLAAVAAPAPTFPGPMRYDAAHNVVIFGWDKRGGAPGGDAINLAVSFDRGTTWFNCRAATAPVDAAGFVTADYDRDGNIYVAYAEKEKYHTYLTVLRQENVSKCRNPAASLTQPTTNPGFSTPVQVDRNAVRTTVFPWLTAGPEPGRVAEHRHVRRVLGRVREPVAERTDRRADVQPGEGNHAPVPLRLDLPERAGLRPGGSAGRPDARRLLRDRLQLAIEGARGRLQPDEQEAQRGPRAHRLPDVRDPDRRAVQRRRHDRAAHSPSRAHVVDGSVRRRDLGVLDAGADAPACTDERAGR